MRELFLMVLLLVGCGGAVDDSAPSPSPPSPVTNAPNSIAPSAGCARACERMTKTCDAIEDDGCVNSCASSFDTPEKAATFAACIDALSCEELVRGAYMDYGPIGECYTRARRGP